MVLLSAGDREFEEEWDHTGDRPQGMQSQHNTNSALVAQNYQLSPQHFCFNRKRKFVLAKIAVLTLNSFNLHNVVKKYKFKLIGFLHLNTLFESVFLKYKLYTCNYIFSKLCRDISNISMDLNS